jgi:hypothetical protein
MSSARVNVFLKMGVCLVWVMLSCENGGGGFHDFVNDAIIPAVFTGVEVVSGNCSKEGGHFVIGAGEVVLNITLENSRNTVYELKILGDDADFVKTSEFVNLTLIRLTLECPEEKEGREGGLDITLHLVQPAGRAQPGDYSLPLTYALGKIPFLHIIPDTVSGPMTKLVLVFAESVADLSENDIAVTVDDGEPFPPQSGSLRWVSEGICEIGIREIIPAQSIAVEIARFGYGHVSQSVDVTVDSKPGEIQFLYAMPYDSYGTTTRLTLVFNQDIPDFSAGDITITGQDRNAPPVSISGEPDRKAAGVYELAVANITETGKITIKITVEKSGCTIDPGFDSQTVEVHYAIPVEFVSVTDADNGSAATTKLILQFSEDITGLAAADDITLNGNTGAGKGSLTKMETGIGTYELALNGIAVPGTVTVTVDKKGYNISPASRTVEIVVLAAFQRVEATTDKLTLQFDRDIEGLAAGDITLDAGSTGAKKKELFKNMDTAGKYTLELEGVKAAGTITVTVKKSGYIIDPESKSATVQYIDTVAFQRVEADGSDTETTTKLFLQFSKDIAGLIASDITLVAGGDTGIGGKGNAGASIGVRVKELFENTDTTGKYTLVLEGVTATGEITVTVSKDGYTISPASQTVQVHYANSVEFVSATAVDGSDTATTTKLFLQFSKDITGLTANNITLDAGNTGFEGEGTAGVYVTELFKNTDTAGKYTLVLEGITAEGTIGVTVGNVDGYLIGSATQMAYVYYAEPVAFQRVEANGTAYEKATTELKLYFDREIYELSETDITLTGLGGVTKGGVSGTGRIYTLALVGEITEAADVSVSVSKSGYAVSGSPTVKVHRKAEGTTVAGANTKSLKEKFGVKETGTEGVTATFKELSAYIQNGGLGRTSNVIETGDWIDLEGGLAVDAYNDAGWFSYWGTSENTRLIVVGINSFQSSEGVLSRDGSTPEGYDYPGMDTPPRHVVFQFQNIPVSRRMNATDTNAGGYPASEMRQYLLQNFLPGLTAAGVPEDALWGPSRVMSTKGGQETINDLLWLPTEREVGSANDPDSASDSSVETAENQARLEYYTDADSRYKGDNWYWLASAAIGRAAPNGFCIWHFNGGYFDSAEASWQGGCAPAFCVR